MSLMMKIEISDELAQDELAFRVVRKWMQEYWQEKARQELNQEMALWQSGEYAG